MKTKYKYQSLYLLFFLFVTSFSNAGEFGGGGGGGTWEAGNPSTCSPEQAALGQGYWAHDFPDTRGKKPYKFKTQAQVCAALAVEYGDDGWWYVGPVSGKPEIDIGNDTAFVCAESYNSGQIVYGSPCIDEEVPPDEECDICQKLNEILMKLDNLGGGNSSDPAVINAINALNITAVGIKNSLSVLTVDNSTQFNDINTYLLDIDNSIGDVLSSNQNIVQNINIVGDKLTEYSLKLGNIEIAIGDIDLYLKNTNRLVLDLGLDLDFIKNKLINDNSKDYEPLLNEIIDILSNSQSSSFDDTALINKLTELESFIKADFVPDTDSTIVDVDDLTNINLDRNLINFGAAQCPPDEPISTMINGFSFTDGFSHVPLCNFFERLAPFIKAFGGFSAALILGGGLRR